MVCPRCQQTSDVLVTRQGTGTDGLSPVCACGARLVCAATQQPTSPTVIDDVLWGGPRFVENLDSTPVWVETKSQYRAELAARGFHQQVRHVPVPGTDKSPMTTSWDVGSAPGHDPRPFCMLTPEEQRVRRAEAAVRLNLSVETLEQLSIIDLAVEQFIARAPSIPAPACEFVAD
jgi:hypothetical protein